MRMTRMKSLVLIMAAVSAFILPVVVCAQTKIGTIDFRTALQNTAEFKKAVQSLEAEFKPRRDELQQLSQELAEIQKKLQTAQPQEAAQLQQEGQIKQRQAQRINEDLQADVQYEQEDILRNSAQRMRGVIAKLAEEKGLDVVFSAAALVDPFEGRLLYLNSALDLTSAATAAYDEAHPAQ